MQEPIRGDEPKYLTVLDFDEHVGLTRGTSVSTTIYKD